MPSNATGFAVSSWGPVIFVLDEIEDMKYDVPLSGEISQHQREGLADSNRNGSTKRAPSSGRGRPACGPGIYVYTLFSAPFGGKVVGLPTKGGSTGGMKHYVSLFALGDARS